MLSVCLCVSVVVCMEVVLFGWFIVVAVLVFLSVGHATLSATLVLVFSV